METLLSLLAGVVIVLVITLATGYFVAQEFAYLAVDRARLTARAAAGDAAAQRTLGITRRTSFMLSGAQLGITVTGLLVGYVAEPLIGVALADVVERGGVSMGISLALGFAGACAIIVAGTLLFGTSILAETGLSFLGFGVQPPDTSLGLLVSDAQSAVLTRPWLFYFPGAFIIVLVLAVNYTGEGLRDAANPKASVVNPLDAKRSRPARTKRAASTGIADRTTDDTLLTVEDLRVAFGDQEVVRGVSLDIRRGEVLALVGESGSGKTLTALSVVGLAPPEAAVEGEIRFDGNLLEGLGFDRWRAIRGKRIAMILQDPSTSLNPVLTIGRQFEDILRMTGLRGAALRRRTVELLAGVSIKDPDRVCAAYPHQLSGGMRQRVVIALAIAQDPDLIIADEPTTALDVTVQAQVMATLASARERTGAAMVFITHDLALVAGIADRVAVMKDGAVVESADVFTIFDQPSDPYTQRLLSLAPSLNLEVGHQ